MVESIPQERICELTGKQSRDVEVPKISRQESVEVVKATPQGRASERMGKQSRVIEVPKISCRESAEVAILQRTVEQYLDTEHEPASRFFGRFR